MLEGEDWAVSEARRISPAVAGRSAGRTRAFAALRMSKIACRVSFGGAESPVSVELTARSLTLCLASTQVARQDCSPGEVGELVRAILAGRPIQGAG